MTDNLKWVKLARFLYQTVGVRRGLGRIAMYMASKDSRLQTLPVVMADGRILTLDLRESMSMPYLLTGEIWGEQGETEFAKYAVREGDTVLDIGANLGWYSTLFSECVGESGRVIGFEPSPSTFGLVSKTAKRYPQMKVLQIALSDSPGEVDFFVASDGAQNSLQRQGNSIKVEKCIAKPLDWVLQNNGIKDVKFIKCDAEGAEMRIVDGATELISGERPPIWMLEINPPLLKQFGSTPAGIFELFQEVRRHDYAFYQISPITNNLEPLPAEFTSKFDTVIAPAWQQELIKEYQRIRQA